MAVGVSCGGLCLALAGDAGFFADVTELSGLSFRHQASKTSRKYLPETMTGGVALLDYDGDGWLDVFFVNGARISVPQKDGDELDKSDPRYWNRLFRNKGDGAFEDVTAAAGVRGYGFGMGVAVGDYDNDGDPDLLVTNMATGSQPAAILYRNEGGRRFVEVTEAAGLRTRGWASSAGFLDYDNDGHLDLFICRYLDWSFEIDRRCGLNTPAGRSYCHPDEFSPLSSYLFRNNGDGAFTDVSDASGIASAKGKSLGVAFGDVNGDGWIDISVANDSVPQFLFRNNGDGAFEEIALLAGAAMDEDGKDFGGMGTELVDLNGDGRLDILTTAISLQRYAYFENLGKEQFEYKTRGSQLGRLTQAYTGWGLRVFDLDNDGGKDLFIANGHVMDTIELSQPPLTYLQPPLLLRFDRGVFQDLGAAGGSLFGKRWAGRGVAAGDLDNDGYVDLVVSNCDGPAYVARNLGKTKSGNNWIGVRLRGRHSNREGIGAEVKVTREGGAPELATVSRAGSYLSSHDPRLFFGLGTSTQPPRIEVRWPGGVRQSIRPSQVNRVIEIEETP